MESCFNIIDFSHFSEFDRSGYGEPQPNVVFNEALEKYLLTEDAYDAELMQKDWFPNVETDVFFSHSHKDCPELIGLAEKLEKKGIHCFIDSLTWGYADDLLHEIDEKVCKDDETDLFDYKQRNNTTAFVHMLLNSALLKMIDKCRCVFFFNTENSIPRKMLLKEYTYSPWIYSEINMCNAIFDDRKRQQDSMLMNFSMEDKAIREAHSQFKAAMHADLRKFEKAQFSVLRRWVNSHETGLDSLIAALRSSRQIGGKERFVE